MIGPAVGGGDGLIQRGVGGGQLGGAGVAALGQGALAQFFFVAGFGDDVIGAGLAHTYGKPFTFKTRALVPKNNWPA